MVFLLLPAPGFLVSPLVTVPTLASNIGIIYPRIPFRFTVVFLVFAFLLAFLFVAFVTLFLSYLSLARCPSVLTCQESCAAQGRRRFSVPVSTLAHAHAKFGKTHDLRRGTTLRRSRSAAGACASMVAT